MRNLVFVMILAVALALISSNSFAWVEGTFKCKNDVFTVTSVSIGATDPVPYLQIKKDDFTRKGFPVLSEDSSGEEALTLSRGGGAISLWFINNVVEPPCQKIR